MRVLAFCKRLLNILYLEEIHVSEIYIGLPDPKLSYYLDDDPAIRHKSVFRYPDELQYKILELNNRCYAESNQNIKYNTYYYINKSSSGFLFDVIREYGGCQEFYMNFVCPLGIVRTNEKGNEVNCNYYENKKLQESPVVESLINRIDWFLHHMEEYAGKT